MSDSPLPYSPASPDFQPHSPTPLLPPLRPPRLRPDSRSSSVLTSPTGSNSNADSGVWSDVTLAAFLEHQGRKLPGMQKDFTRTSPVDMYPATIRALSSPTEDTLSPTYDGDRAWRSELTTNNTCGHHGDSGHPPPHPASTRTTMMSVLLVLTCSGAIIINVS